MNDSDYAHRVSNEIRHYSSYLKTHGDEVKRIEPTVSAFSAAMSVYSDDVQRKGLLDFAAHVISRSQEQGDVSLASLGCGTGDWELDVVKRSNGRIRTTLYDFNAALLRNVSREAKAEGLPLETEVGDVNHLELAPASVDFVLCRSSLHHFLELEHIFQQIRGALKPNGEFLVLGEVIGRNGLQLYPETEEFLNRLFRTLPARLRTNSYTGEVDEVVPNVDHSVNLFEAVRSQDILPELLDHFRPVAHITLDAIISPLLDFRYGPNYNIEDECDRAIVLIIGETDRQLVRSGVLQPTALHGIYC